MTTAEIAKYAKAGHLPQGRQFSCPERCLFYALNNLYMMFQENRITAEQGEEEKKAALLQYQKDMSEYQRNISLIQHQAELWKQIELTASAYRNDPSIEHADAFLAAVYGVNRKISNSNVKIDPERDQMIKSPFYGT